MNRTIVLLAGALLLWSGPCLGGPPTGEEILNGIDENMSSQTRILTSRMITHGRRSTRTIESKTWSEGQSRAFTEYLSPARERGTKMLKLDDKLWTYSPATDRIIRISGHMLRQSVMGSDLSYEDMMEDPRLAENYRARLEGEETLAGRDCWVVLLTARSPETAYRSRRIWVDKIRYVPLREELFAKSGKLLKKMDLTHVVRLEGRWFPRRMVFKDMLKKGKGTEFIIETITFDQDIPAPIFSKAALRK